MILDQGENLQSPIPTLLVHDVGGAGVGRTPQMS